MRHADLSNLPFHVPCTMHLPQEAIFSSKPGSLGAKIGARLPAFPCLENSFYNIWRHTTRELESDREFRTALRCEYCCPSISIAAKRFEQLFGLDEVWTLKRISSNFSSVFCAGVSTELVVRMTSTSAAASIVFWSSYPTHTRQLF